VVASHQDAAPERPAAGEAVDPGDGVAAEALLLLEAREDLFEVLPAPLDDAHPRRLERQERQACREDDAGQPHAADRGVERFGVLRRGAAERLARGEEEVSSSTWRPIVPSTWWFLPWMSAASAPPTVTKRVPGTTGRKSRAGGGTRGGARARCPPRSDAPPLGIEREDPAEPLGQDDAPAPFSAESP
jgi:hypothetical protein